MHIVKAKSIGGKLPTGTEELGFVVISVDEGIDVVLELFEAG